LSFVLAVGASAFDMRDARAGGLGRTVLLSRPMAVNLINGPSDGLEIGTWEGEAGYNRRFEMADLDYLFIAGACRRRSVTIALGASQFGKADLYAEQMLKGSIAYHYRRVTFGGSLSAMQLQIGNGYGGLRAATVGLGAALTSHRFRVSLAADNLTKPRFVDNGTPAKPTFTLLTEYHGHQAFSLTGRVRWEDLQKPQFGLGQMIRLSGESVFFWGIGTAPLEYGGGIELNIPFGSLTYAATIHPVLGLSHTVTLSYKSWYRKSKGGGEFD
jgi:hypothetical protein